MRTIIALAMVLTASVDTLTCLSGPAIAEEGADQLRGQQLNFGVPAAVIAYEQGRQFCRRSSLRWNARSKCSSCN